eukprot:TRINITY_DN7045_c0_g1_i23.p1 TRINITY_DN7045_c0_g1~~TRINITY_DN7045_c0_g1_i23.p1  ORF type:complete len:603 (+),score=131.00 TRINITY_DN7045_c0_g1_i23:1334-3142(+)
MRRTRRTWWAVSKLPADSTISATVTATITIACYMNACIQCLANTVHLKEFFLDGETWKSHVNIKNRTNLPEIFVNSFAKLVEQLWTSNEFFVKPTTFKEVVCYINKYFQGREQHDAQEFLLFLINGLSDSMNLCTNRPSIDLCWPGWTNKKELLDVAMEFWSLHMAGNWSLFNWLFAGLLVSELQCKNCCRWSWTFEPFVDLSLPVAISEEFVLSVMLVPLVVSGSELLSVKLLVKKNDTVGSIVDKFYEKEDTGFRPKSQSTELVMAIIVYGRVIQVLHHSIQLGKLDHVSQTRSLYVFETIIKNTTEIIEEDKEISSSSDYVIDKYLSYNQPVPKPPTEFYDYFTHVFDRIIFSRESFVWKHYDITNGGNPIVILLSTFLTGHELYERVWTSITRFLKPSSQYLTGSKGCWWKSYAEHPQCADKRPFVIRTIDPITGACSKCHWTKHCLGCMVLPSRERIGYVSNISIDWYWDVYKEDYVTITGVKEEAGEAKQKAIRIYDLLKKFTAMEEVTNMKCEVTDEVSEHARRLTILKLPVVLIINLKRYSDEYFALPCSLQRKNNALVDFPIEGLDLREFLNPGVNIDITTYDLYAVVVRFLD